MAAFGGSTGGTTTTASRERTTIDRFIPAKTLEVAKYNAVLYQPRPASADSEGREQHRHLHQDQSPGAPEQCRWPKPTAGTRPRCPRSRVSCVTEAWGAWVAISSLGAYIARDSPADARGGAPRRQLGAGPSIARSCGVLLSGTNVFFGGTATSRAGLGAGDVITTALMRKVRARLKRDGRALLRRQQARARRPARKWSPTSRPDPTFVECGESINSYDVLDPAVRSGSWMGFRINESNTIPIDRRRRRPRARPSPRRSRRFPRPPSTRRRRPRTSTSSSRRTTSTGSSTRPTRWSAPRTSPSATSCRWCCRRSRAPRRRSTST